MPNLVGIGLSQVPTNSMLGGMAYQDPDRVKIKKLNVDEISQINSEIADTAVDIFVYDTSKDSDGGAWRKRTTHTSWYNETLGTATRGTRSEFPAVAVIVVESYKLTIYDGDDPGLPMWMVFNSPTTSNTDGQLTMLGANGDAITSVSALNGIIAVGESTSYGGLVEIIFLSDTARRRRGSITTNGTHGYWNSKFISARNTGSGTVRGYDNTLNTSSDRLVADNLNDVAMTVLPNAPIDSATGLPVPTIAVGTNDGISIIKDDGIVVDYTHQNATYDVTSFVEFLSDDRVAYGWDNNITPRRLHVTPVRSADTVTVDLASYPIDSVDTVGYGRPTDNKDVSNYHGHLIGDDQSVAAAMSGSMIAVGDGSDGLNLVDVQVAGDDTFNSLVAFAATSYNTGWQYGNIKGTFLSDTDDTNLSTTDLGLITNGDFSNGTTGWSNNATEIFTVSGGGVASVDRNGGSAQGQCYQTITTEVGRTYTVGVLVSAVSDGFQVYADQGSSVMSQGAINSTGTHYWTFTATTTSTRLDFSAVQNVNGTASFDNITIFDGVADRSVNSKGLAVYGTITKSAVTTGADLVGYSPSSNTSYLEQPYNSDLDYGTGDMYYSMWIYANSSDTFSSSTYIFERSSISDTNNRRIEARMTTSTRLEIYSGGQTLDNNVPVPRDSWYKLDILRRSGEAFVYINGEYHSSTTGAAATRSLTDTSAKLVIGNRAYFATRQYGWPSNSKIALFRTGASGPSAEQVKKMYEDEKFLFQENAKATLYGSSDAVTALSYDEVTDQLHVGTSSGRSNFQGLRRINNTTTAVTTAISAHDGFIVEQ